MAAAILVDWGVTSQLDAPRESLGATIALEDLDFAVGVKIIHVLAVEQVNDDVVAILVRHLNLGRFLVGAFANFVLKVRLYAEAGFGFDRFLFTKRWYLLIKKHTNKPILINTTYTQVLRDIIVAEFLVQHRFALFEHIHIVVLSAFF